MINLYFDKLYRYSRISEPVFTAIPCKKGELQDPSEVVILQNGQPVPFQTKVTSRYEDGSVRYLFVRFLADLPGNAKAVLSCDLHGKKKSPATQMRLLETEEGISVDTGALSFAVRNHSQNIFEILKVNDKIYTAEQFDGPVLKDGDGESYQMEIGEWKVIENGPVSTILSAKGSNIGSKKIDFELRLTAYAQKPWVDISYRIINTTEDPLHVASLVFTLKADQQKDMNLSLRDMHFDSDTDSTGCGDGMLDNSNNRGTLFHTRGIAELEEIEGKTPVSTVRTIAASSNYKTDFYIGSHGETVDKVVDAHYLIKEANEHFAEVLYGTFFADRTDESGGVCATIWQAQQNYPKAVKADIDGIAVMLVPENVEKVVMQSGMAREQRFMLHFHEAAESIKEIDNRSLIYQMPDRPYVLPEVFKEAKVSMDVFPEKIDDDVENALIEKCDGHSRCYGMLNWGDTPDSGYTDQGRGNGEQVWSNNEYDFPHSCALLYMRTGVRRFLDYVLVTASHWMDVDVCHYSNDPLRIGGQWEHTNGHCKNGIMVCSHEWVEGLFDYYHFSGDERGYETAIGIGENVLRLLETPMFAHTGEANARETGWALRTLTALYVETHDEKWLQKAEWIIDNFKAWEEEYGNWLAPYTDNTTIRVGFMISVAVGSLMRYYRVFPREDIKNMILRAVDDLLDNCMLPNGLFYYKELPSLNRLGNNALLLESLSIAYELTKDARYLVPGKRTFAKAINKSAGKIVGKKQIFGDAVIGAGGGTKNFAQSFIPLITYYKAASENDLL